MKDAASSPVLLIYNFPKNGFGGVKLTPVDRGLETQTVSYVSRLGRVFGISMWGKWILMG